ncbi:MAG: DMT family transporter [Clostridiales Family XIII bacterium]|nr:DMT family transporter [Clostridiales Family XIII bacterium]
MSNLFKSRKFAYVTMTLLVFAWGYEYVAAKAALETFSSFVLVGLKYIIGCVILVTAKCIIDRRFVFKLRDLPILVTCSIFGELLYFAFEYEAMDYLPVSVITIVLAFVPALSVITELVLFKRKANTLIVGGIIVGIIGVGLVIGADFSSLFSGSAIGYLLIIGAVFSWNIYNFLTDKLGDNYKPLDLTVYQTICTTLLSLPFLLHDLPPLSAFTPEVIWALLYLGIICECLGYIILVNGIDKLGPTPCAIFSNMLPVTSTFFAWLCLGEHIQGLQVIGGIIVIASGVVVIREKQRLSDVQLSHQADNKERQ